MRGSQSRLRGCIWSWMLAALASQAGACKTSNARTASWSSRGDALGQRVRDGQIEGVTHLRFVSTVLGREVGAVVATPPGYQRSVERRHPVVYLFPGIGGDEWTYLRDVTLDNAAVRRLFADPQSAPILVFANPADSAGEGRAQRVLCDELVREVDERFRTRRAASARALEGFSLGGVTALNLYLQRPDLFGRAVAVSSACYLLSSCETLRAKLVMRARQLEHPQVMLVTGGRESAQNRVIGDELAPLLGATVETVDDADHDWATLLRTASLGTPLGRRIADFHLQGFATVSAQQ